MVRMAAAIILHYICILSRPVSVCHLYHSIENEGDRTVYERSEPETCCCTEESPVSTFHRVLGAWKCACSDRILDPSPVIHTSILGESGCRRETPDRLALDLISPDSMAYSRPIYTILVMRTSSRARWETGRTSYTASLPRITVFEHRVLHQHTPATITGDPRLCSHGR